LVVKFEAAKLSVQLIQKAFFIHNFSPPQKVGSGENNSFSRKGQTKTFVCYETITYLDKLFASFILLFNQNNLDESNF